MDPIMLRSLRDSTTWYANQGQDGAGDITFDDGTTIKCLIIGKRQIIIASRTAKISTDQANESIEEELKVDYTVYVDYTVHPVKEDDELIINGKRLSVQGTAVVTPINPKQHALGVLYL